MLHKAWDEAENGLCGPNLHRARNGLPHFARRFRADTSRDTLTINRQLQTPYRFFARPAAFWQAVEVIATDGPD